MNEDTPGRGSPPQLHIWDASAREFELGSLVDGEESWQVFVLVERTAPDLCRGRVSFRRGEERHDSEAILVEEDEAELLRRAAELPASMLRRILTTLQG
ncbi:MAG: hypothetical protein RRA92_03800 [Gemmatimonadota bacterium]|nr:hypothetical protein [Gemmatimonadota bacterium]